MVVQAGRAVIWAVLFSATGAMADPLSDSIVAQLREQGFDRITMTRTWLGRILIIGFDETGQREVVLNPNTGEVLRDYFRADVEIAVGRDGGSAPVIRLPAGNGGRPNRDQTPDKPDRNPPDGTGGGGETEVDTSGNGDDGGAIGDEGPGVPPDDPPVTPDDEIKE